MAVTLDLRLPLRIRPYPESFGIEDASETLICFVFYDDASDPVRRSARKRMTRDQAEEVAKITARALTSAIAGS